MSRIAVIGTGISGMGASWLLNKSHDITVYEKSPDIGGHSRTKAVRHGDRTIAVDTGFIVFNHRNYPNLCALFKQLGVPTEKSNMTFSLSANNASFEWGAASLNAVFGQRGNVFKPVYWRFIADIIKFNFLALKTARRHPQLTLGELLETLGVGEWYAKYFILPIGGAIWSCPVNEMLSYPALTFVEFFEAHGLLSIVGQPQWYTVSGGSVEYVKRLTAPFKDKILTNCEVTGVKRAGGRVYITDIRGTTLEYDHVIFASHGDQALAVLKDAGEEERSVLSAFRYQRNVAFLHKDASVMPKRKACWASWVYHHEDSDRRGVIPVTYWMNLLQNIDRNYPLFVTLNPITPIAKEDIFDEHVFYHPIYSQDAIESQKRIAALQGQQNTWFCGAHLRHGFHEDGLASAVAVAGRLGVKAPWH
jgi:predicted NAD/FAD-binding protein